MCLIRMKKSAITSGTIQYLRLIIPYEYDYNIQLRGQTGMERDKRESGLTKRSKEMEMERQGVGIDTGGYIQDRLR